MQRSKANEVRGPMDQSLQFRVLNDAQCQKIVEASFDILENTGVAMKNARARDILGSNGCKVDGENVKIPQSLVEDCLKTAPREIRIYDRNGNPAMLLGADTGDSYFGPGMCNVYRIDSRTGERRLAVKRDAYEAGLVVDTLPNIDMVNGLTLISDCDPDLAASYEVRELLETTTKPIILMCTNVIEVDANYKMLCEVAGSPEAFAEKPFAVAGATSTAPLVHNDVNIDTLLYMFEKGIPTPYVASPMIGATGPVTLAGTLAVAVADTLVGLVLSQLVNPGSPFLGCCWPDMMDMRTTGFTHTAPELALGSVGGTDVMHYLGLPNVCHLGMTDSPVFDEQAAMDLTSQLFLAMLSGSNLNWFAGFLETAMSGCLEALCFANDAVGYLDRIVEGIAVDDETLALDMIEEVGPGGNYLAEEHTLEHYHDNWAPSGALSREGWDGFVESGSKDYAQRANDLVNEAIDGGIRDPLPEGVLSSLDDIMADAQARMDAAGK